MPAIDYGEHAPPPGLRRFVRCVWTLDSPGPADEGPGIGEDRVLPDGCAEIVLHHRAAFERRGGEDAEATTQHRHAVVGQIESALPLRPLGPVGILGIRLEPWAAGPFLGVAAHELTGRSVALEDVWGHAGERLAGAVEESRDDASRVAAAFRHLSLRAAALDGAAARRSAAEEAVAALRRGAGTSRVGDVCDEVGLTGRTLERRFREDVGVAPKTFARILRFRRAVAMLRGSPRPSLVGAALACGYADQAHLTRDFREFAGEAPGAWLRGEHPLADVF